MRSPAHPNSTLPSTASCGRSVVLVVATLLASAALHAAVDDDRRLAVVQAGALAQGDALSDGRFEDIVPVELDKGPALFRLHSSDFDAAMRIVGPDGTSQENDDFGTATDAGINLVVKTAGTFEVHVTSSNPGESGAYKLDIKGVKLSAGKSLAANTTFDRMQLISGQELLGKAAFSNMTITCAMGSMPLVIAQVTSLKHETSGQTTVLLRNGSRLLGTVDGGAITFKVGSGSELTVPLRDVAVFVPVVGNAADPGKDPVAVWVSLGGCRLAATWSAETVAVTCALGPLTLKVADIAEMSAPGKDRALGQILLKDGSRLSIAPAAVPLTLLGFDQPVPAGVAVEAGKPEALSDALSVTLTSGDEVVGKLGELKLESPYGAVAIAAGQVMALTVDADCPDQVVVSLASGERAFGRITQPTLTITTAWNTALAIPREMLKGVKGGKGDAKKAE